MYKQLDPYDMFVKYTHWLVVQVVQWDSLQLVEPVLLVVPVVPVVPVVLVKSLYIYIKHTCQFIQYFFDCLTSFL